MNIVSSSNAISKPISNAVKQMSFESTAIQIFPELANSDNISRRQIKVIQEKTGASWPSHIANSTNTISRGLYRFNIPADTINTAEPVKTETDAEIDARIRETYSNMELLVDSVAQGNITSLLISGSAGVGKSYLVKQTLEKSDVATYSYVRGYVKPTGIFKLLWENRFTNNVLVFDDADSVFEDAVGLNLLKAALELSKTRKICWMSEKQFLDETGGEIPSYFDYEGQIIFLTNMDFHELINKGSKLSPHLTALDSRSLYMDLKVKTNREKMIRIKQVVSESSIMIDRGIYADEEKVLMEFLIDNVDKLREVSLRTVEKLASLYLTSPSKWSELAKSVMFK